MSCLGKLFNSILNTRINEYLTENNVISKTQIGFQKKARTTDHTLIEKCTKQNKSKLLPALLISRKHLILCYTKLYF